MSERDHSKLARLGCLAVPTLCGLATVLPLALSAYLVTTKENIILHPPSGGTFHFGEDQGPRGYSFAIEHVQGGVANGVEIIIKQDGNGNYYGQITREYPNPWQGYQETEDWRFENVDLNPLK